MLALSLAPLEEDMSKTKRKAPKRTFEYKPLERHIAKRQCWQCGEWFPEEEISQDHDEQGRSTGWYCGSCI